MTTNKSKTVLITGASSGIGLETAKMFKLRGFEVHAAARRIENMESLKEIGINIHYLDVTDDASIDKLFNEIKAISHGIDILINNAGYGSYGAVEDLSIDDARKQFDVNLFGLAAITRNVLPYMREQRYGKIINISSVGGKMVSPLGSWYHATKFAVEGFSDCLRLEVKQFGIDVIIIEPGPIRSEWLDISVKNLIKTSNNGVYKDFTERVTQTMRKIYKNSVVTPGPEAIVKVIEKAILDKNPKVRYVSPWPAQIMLFLKWLMPDKFFEYLTLLMYTKLGK